LLRSAGTVRRAEPLRHAALAGDWLRGRALLQRERLGPLRRLLSSNRSRR
jgi:hypothetical protein